MVSTSVNHPNRDRQQTPALSCQLHAEAPAGPAGKHPTDWPPVALSRRQNLFHLITAYTVLAQQSLDAAQADTELLSYRLSCSPRPVEIDHHLKIFGGEAITQPPRPDHAIRSVLGTRAVALTALRQDRSHPLELF